MNNVDIGYWLSPDGQLIESPAQSHAHSIAKIFNIPFVEDKTILYYRIAFENNYIRIIQTKDSELNIQLTKPATKTQKKIIRDFFETSGKTLIIFGWYDAEVISISQLNRILSGKINISVPVNIPIE